MHVNITLAVPVCQCDANKRLIERWLRGGVAAEKLATSRTRTDLRPMNEIRSARRRRTGTKPELGPAGTPLHVAVAPGESDERYQSRFDLLAALLDHAKQHG
jgi:hypothetical protein